MCGNQTRISHTDEPKTKSISTLQHMESTENRARVPFPPENDLPSKTIAATKEMNVRIRPNVK